MGGSSSRGRVALAARGVGKKRERLSDFWMRVWIACADSALFLAPSSRHAAFAFASSFNTSISAWDTAKVTDLFGSEFDVVVWESRREMLGGEGEAGGVEVWGGRRRG